MKKIKELMLIQQKKGLFFMEWIMMVSDKWFWVQIYSQLNLKILLNLVQEMIKNHV